MRVKIRIQRPLFLAARPRLAVQAAQPARVERTFQATLSACAEDWVVKRPTPAPAARIVRPKPTRPQPAGPGSLTRAFTWLQAKYALSAAKRLRVSETVSLGEKRFVAIVKVEGREFLIGGGPSGVSLLTTLKESSEGGAAVGDGVDNGLAGALDLDIPGDIE